MTRELFVDANILIRLYNEHVDQHEEVTRRMQALELVFDKIWISRQVLREYLSTMSRPQPWGLPVPAKDLLSQMTEFEESFWVADETQAVSKQLWRLIDTVRVGGKQIHDANIVATMLAYGITHLYTLNRSDFERFEKEITLVTVADSAS
jgi:predicted nucleic acid-binding protein